MQRKKWRGRSPLFFTLVSLLFLLSACGATTSSTPATSQATTPAVNTATATTQGASGKTVTTTDAAAQCYVNMVQAKNLDGLVNCFAASGVVLDVSRRITGRDAIRTWASNEVIGGSLQILEDHPHTNGTRLLVHWAPQGSAGWRAWYDFMTQNGHITQASLQYA